MSRRLFLFALLPVPAIIAGPESLIAKADVLKLVNQSRTQARRPSLRVHPALGRAAQARANHMVANGYFAHTTPDGRSPWTFILAEGYTYSHVGENLGEGFPTATRQHEFWMKSPNHRENILSPAFTETGIGVAQSRNGAIVVQLFASPAK